MGDEVIAFEQFEGIRTHRDSNGEIWYVIVDVVEVLTESPRASSYWSEMKKRDKHGELLAICEKFSIPHRTNGRKYGMDCANQKGLLQIIQLIPSRKAEPFRKWLAMLGDRRLDEMRQDPLEMKREQLRLLGFSEEEIEIRIDLIKTGNMLDAVWTDHGIEPDGKEMLTDEIHKGTFEGMTRLEHANLKKLDDEEVLEDHMNHLESAFSNLGKAFTLENIRQDDPQALDEHKDAAERAGKTAGRIRERYEDESGHTVISAESPLVEKRKRLGSEEQENNVEG